MPKKLGFTLSFIHTRDILVFFMVAKSELFCQSEAASRIGEIRELFMRQERRTLLHATGATGYFLAFTSSLGLPLGIAQLHGGLLHDVAKSYPPFYRLARLRREFTREDEQVMALHPEFGYWVIEKKRLGPLVDQEIVRYHHRLFHKDGEAIPLTVRAFSVCDGYDALREDRPYRKGYSHEEALELLRLDSGYRYDPRLVRQFEAHVERFDNPFIRQANATRGIIF